MDVVASMFAFGIILIIELFGFIRGLEKDNEAIRELQKASEKYI